MALKLNYKGTTSIPVEVEGLTPDWACDKSLAEIERFEVFHGNQAIPLAELFSLSGAPDDRRFDFEGDMSGVHWIGAHMRSGSIFIHGPGGRHLGSQMRGGEIHVDGDGGGWLGCEMRGGLIHLHGNAGHLVGAAYRGSAKGMRGGTILVDGNAGNEIGLLMQQGLIAIGGDAGEMLGFNMADGTIIVTGNCGRRAGAGMRGGVIAMFGPKAPPMLPSFRCEGSAQPARIHDTLRSLSAPNWLTAASSLPASVDVYRGDMLESGHGEIYIRRIEAA
jgi:formylmethanofuran dehydrogenase subunit C